MQSLEDVRTLVANLATNVFAIVRNSFRLPKNLCHSAIQEGNLRLFSDITDGKIRVEPNTDLNKF